MRVERERGILPWSRFVACRGGGDAIQAIAWIRAFWGEHCVPWRWEEQANGQRLFRRYRSANRSIRIILTRSARYICRFSKTV